MKVINFQETRQRFEGSGRSITKFAKLHGFHPGTFGIFLRGKYVASPDSHGYLEMSRALRDIGCLVEEENESNHADRN